MSTHTSPAPNATDTASAATYVLPELPYELDALAPVMSAELLDIHYNKHHQSYVKKANELVESLSSQPEGPDLSPLLRALSFNVSGHALHSLFWRSMTPASSKPSDELRSAINTAFGSEEALRNRLRSAVATLTGSGWGALAWEPIAERLVVMQIHDHQSDLIVGATPILVIDGWEHAYYLDYRSDRATWAERFFELADWDATSTRFSELTTSDTVRSATAA